MGGRVTVVARDPSGARGVEHRGGNRNTKCSVLQERFDSQALTLKFAKEQSGDLQECLVMSESAHATKLESTICKFNTELAVLREQKASLQATLNQVTEEFATHRTGFLAIASHDLERALRRFWLRGTCAKQDNCEFLHHLPKDVDMSSLSAAMLRANVPPGTGPLAMHTAAMQGPSPDDFPALSVDGNKARRGAYSYQPALCGPYKCSYMNDPGRTRFAATVKKPVAREREMDPTPRGAARSHGLRPPALLPTLSMGDAVQSLYMAYRARVLQLGAARNACLSRAADAWRRG
ncbi:hypothetical protein B0H14DRAFT_3598803 [Mycena olivaceomarginata]|nr:hypothetical protein B0H14DRAFT_3598803 [Mycena olivaceomarginata]